MDTSFPINLDRKANVAVIFDTLAKRGQAVTFDGAVNDNHVRAVTSETDFVIGFASGMDYGKGDDGQIFTQDGEIYALNGGRPLAKGQAFSVDKKGALARAESTDTVLGYALKDIPADLIGPVYFSRFRNSKFEIVTFKSVVRAGQCVKQGAGHAEVTVVTGAADIVYGFPVNNNALNDVGYIYTATEGNVVLIRAGGVNLAKNVRVKINNVGSALIATANKDKVLGFTLEDCLKNTAGRVKLAKENLNI